MNLSTMMKKLLAVLAALGACATAHAAITTSIEGGTSYIHLGRLSANECRAILASPVSASHHFAFDGHILTPDASLCHAGVRLDLVSEEPVITTTKTGVTTWPLARSQCLALASDVLKRHGVVEVNHQVLTDAAHVDAACVASANAVTESL
jgi:hypothetical protein